MESKQEKKGIMILEKGSDEAKAYMARIRAMRGQKKTAGSSEVAKATGKRKQSCAGSK